MARTKGIAVAPDRVRRARIEAGLTLQELAGGVRSRALMHQIERGLVRPGEHTLAQIAFATGKPLAYFMDEDSVSVDQVSADQWRYLARRLLRHAAFVEGAADKFDDDSLQRRSLQMIASNLRSSVRVLVAMFSPTYRGDDGAPTVAQAEALRDHDWGDDWDSLPEVQLDDE